MKKIINSHISVDMTVDLFHSDENQSFVTIRCDKIEVTVDGVMKLYRKIFNYETYTYMGEFEDWDYYEIEEWKNV